MGEAFTVETQITFPEYRRFAWFKSLRIGRYFWVGVILLSVFCILMVTAATIQFLEHGFNRSYLVTELLVIYPPVLYFSNAIRISRGYKKSGGTPRQFSFGEKELQVTELGALRKPPAVYPYWKLRRAFDTKDAFYLDVGEDEYLILPHRSMDDVTREQLSELLKKGLGKKYIKC